MRLSELPNIDKTLERRLLQAGIRDEAELRALGSREAFLRLRAVEGDTCFSALCALEGALRGIRRHDLDDAAKADLKAFFDALD